MKTKEEVYDEEINPLMAKIIAICKRDKIAMICNFYLNDDLQCTTALLSDEYNPTEAQLHALDYIRRN